MYHIRNVQHIFNILSRDFMHLYPKILSNLLKKSVLKKIPNTKCKSF